MSYGYCKTEFNYWQATCHGGWWRFFGDLNHISGIFPVLPVHKGKKLAKPT
jgi:hypothetical protein